jgi:hypothetical protein
MLPIRRSAALAAGLLSACLVLLALVPGCSAEDGYSRYRPRRAELHERVEDDVQAMIEGMQRAHIDP